MTSQNSPRNLRHLQDSGLKIDTHGRLSDWADRPGFEAQPVMAPGKRRHTRTEFTREDEYLLSLWCTAAEIQGGLTGTAVFEQLECLRPTHSWQAYEARWRRGDLPKQPQPFPHQQRAFIGLQFNTEEGPHSLSHSDSVNDVVSTQRPDRLEATTETYSDFRVDIFRVVCERLHVDLDEFHQFLAQERVVDAYIEFADCSLEIQRTVEQQNIRETGQLLRTSKDKSHHRWKAARAISVIQNSSRRYLGPLIDKEEWTEDDHDIRFIVRLVVGYQEQRVELDTNEVNGSVHAYVDRALWLMLWLRWLYKPVLGQSQEMQRLKHQKEGWLSILEGLRKSRLSSVSVDIDTAGSEAQDEAVEPNVITTTALSAYSDTLIDPQNTGLPLNYHTQGEVSADLTVTSNFDISDAGPSMPSPDERSVGTAWFEQDHMSLEVMNEDPASSQSPPDLDAVPADTQTAVEQTPAPCLYEPSRQTPEIRAQDPISTLTSSSTRPQSLELPEMSVTGTPPTETFPTQEELSPPHASADLTSGSGRVDTQLKSKLPVPCYQISLSKQKRQQRGVFWLTEDAYIAYTNQRDQRLRDWGVSARHTGTCIIVPAIWGEASAIDVMTRFTLADCPADEKSTRRLHFHLGDMSSSWARAAAWFEPWSNHPRRALDLDVFQAGLESPWPEMHGSHLCHHGLCILPEHVVLEPKEVNFSRNSCAAAARTLRTYGMDAPKHCVKHQPPCLLQQASLTTLEVLLIQFYVLRTSRNIAPAETPERPDTHPVWYKTFESTLPLTMTAPAVTVQYDHLVNSDETPRTTNQDRYRIRCRFCLRVQRTWTQITAYWSHLKNQHEEIPRELRLAEIKRTAQEYSHWVKTRSFDYERNNSQTWSKMLQAQASNFSWDVVEGWRLHQERHHRKEQTVIVGNREATNGK